MAAVKIPTSADIYLEVNGVRVAVVQSYKVTATRSNFAELDNFSLVVCKPDRNVIYSGCQWSRLEESAEVGGNVMEKVTIEAARRTETGL